MLKPNSTVSINASIWRNALLWSLVFIAFFGYAQPDTLTGKVFNTVEIFHHDSIQLVPQIQSTVAGGVVLREEIERRMPDDLGEITRAFPGVFLRSYGGVGGLKTMNARGLGSQHFVVVMNGMPAIFHQNGSTNLGDAQADFIEAVKFSQGGADEWSLPVLSKSHGGILQVFTTDYLFIPNRKKVEISGLYGSFNRHKWSANTYFAGKKAYFAANGYGMYFGGEYPFTYHNGLQEISDTRQFNTVREYAFRAAGGIQFRRNQLLQLGVQYFNSEKVLPGAIVFYQPDHFQTLLTENLAANAQHQWFKKRIQTKSYVNVGRQFTDYRNAFALGGEQMDQFAEITTDVSHTGKVELKPAFAVNWGVQYLYGTLEGNTDIVQSPRRHRSFGLLGATWKPNKWIVRAEFPFQLLSERNHRDSSWIQTPIFTPNLGANYRWMKGNQMLAFRTSIGQTARVATFNELFFGQIGNTNLRPERAKMVNIGGSWSVNTTSKWRAEITVDGFAGHITDKIVTLPTQNLFVWSVRNIGEVFSYGFDASTLIEKRAQNDVWSITLIQKTALNVSTDITERGSPTYGHQIPYTPYWNYSGELVGGWKFLQLSYEVGYYDFRFVLGENIAANVLDEYWLHGIRLSSTFRLKNCQVRLYGKVNNLFDTQYEVMRSFPMPGRNYEVGLKFSWNEK
jgi:vitamin B12 transporter